MIHIRHIILIFTIALYMISCSSNKKDSKNIDSETSKEQKIDSANKAISNESKKLKSEDRYPKVLTYNEIIEKNQELFKDYEESKKYSTDTIKRKIQMNQYFYNYLTTQLKYMLSSELKLLRNEFFARKGYKFESDDLKDYFSEYYWYNAKIDSANNIEFSPFERDVIDTIKAYEKENKDLNEKSLKKTFRDYCKNNLKSENDRNFIEVPSILFRRNIGYQVESLPDHNKYWFNGEFLRIQIIDTLKNDKLLFGLFGQIMCPAEFCFWGGEIVTCDSSLEYLDSKSIEFETIDYSENEDNKYYKFDAPNSHLTTKVRIDNDGKIRIE
jgi:hypothetical protein